MSSSTTLEAFWTSESNYPQITKIRISEKKDVDSEYLNLAEEIANDSKAEPHIAVKEKGNERRKKKVVHVNSSDESQADDDEYENDEILEKKKKSLKNSRKSILTKEQREMEKLTKFTEQLENQVQSKEIGSESEEMDFSSEEEDDDDSEIEEEDDDNSFYSNDQEF